MNSFGGPDLLLQITYLVAAVLFILSLKLMSSPKTARHGGGRLGMLLAIIGTLLHHGIVDYRWIAIGLVLGSTWRPAGHGAHDGRSAKDSTESRVWRALRDAGGHVGVLFARAECRHS